SRPRTLGPLDPSGVRSRRHFESVASPREVARHPRVSRHSALPTQCFTFDHGTIRSPHTALSRSVGPPRPRSRERGFGGEGTRTTSRHVQVVSKLPPAPNLRHTFQQLPSR